MYVFCHTFLNLLPSAVHHVDVEQELHTRILHEERVVGQRSRCLNGGNLKYLIY
jgi:hypothetical protein